LFLLCGAISFFLLSRANLSIPMGTAYAVWTGIGAAGTAVVGMCFFREPATWPRLALIAVMIGCIAGLKLLDGHGK
jgi:quaternary ammonium compound-resistance protein SugE